MCVDQLQFDWQVIGQCVYWDIYCWVVGEIGKVGEVGD